jgi:hypothetical protein
VSNSPPRVHTPGGASGFFQLDPHEEADLSGEIRCSPDGRYLLYSQLDENTSNIMLVSNFREPDVGKTFS